MANLLKADILKILSKDVSGGNDTRPLFDSEPKTFFGGKDTTDF